MKIPSLKHLCPKNQKFAGQKEILTMEKLLAVGCEKGFVDAGYRSLLAPPWHSHSPAPMPGQFASYKTRERQNQIHQLVERN